LLELTRRPARAGLHRTRVINSAGSPAHMETEKWLV
jgi:hypothetical protein